MISFDLRTVIFTFVLINVVSSLVLVFLWLNSRNRYKGVGRLVISFSFQMLAYVLIMLRGNLPLWISMDAGNAISLIGIVIGYTGLQEYSGRKISYLTGSIIFFASAFLHAWFRFITPDPTARYLIISFAYLILFAQCAYLLIFKAKYPSKLSRFTGFVFAGFATLALIKIADFLFIGNKPVDYFQSGNFEAFTMIVYQVFIILLTISITLMLSQNLLTDVKSEEEKFSTIFQSAPNAIVLSSFPDGEVITVNNSFYEITRYNEGEVQGKNFFDILKWKNDKDRTFVIDQLTKSGLVSRKEFQFIKNSGECFTGLYSSKVISIAGGGRMVTTIYDISEKKHLQDVIKSERNFMRTLLDNLPDPVYVINSEGRFVLSNHAHTRFMGSDDETAITGKSLFDFFNKEDAENIQKDINNVLREGKRIIDKNELLRNPENGFPCWQLTSRIPLFDDEGKTISVLNISHDITEKKRSEDALRETDKFNRSLLKTIPFGMDIVDEDGTILFMGENFRKMFGNDAVGKKCWTLYRDDGRQCDGCPLKDGIKTETTESFESAGLIGGKIFEINHTGMLFHGKKAILEVFHDITERKKNEGELIKSKEKAEENDRLKTAFLHNISHEIRTPMNAIVGFANLLRESEHSVEENKAYIDIISKSSNHLLSIINDVIEISSIEAGMIKLEPKEFKPAGLVNEVFRNFEALAAGKGIKFETDIPADVDKTIINDRAKLSRILTNLLDNAFKFTVNGKVTIGYSVKDMYLEFYVSDTGIGIDPGLQPRVFDRFYQVDNSATRLHEGTGIGLSICQAFVELMGGKIWLKSIPGRGSVFCFTIPEKIVFQQVVISAKPKQNYLL